MAKFDANWWFGKNSAWQQSGLGGAVASGTGGFFGSISSFFRGDTQPRVEHGLSKETMYVAGALLLIIFMKK